jgi:hypothetical protein
MGWSELAPTNAPVADEPVEAVFWMDENPILPARFFFFFHLFSTPKFSPVLPTTYLPRSYLPPTSPRPTYHLPPPVLPTTYLPPSYLPPTSPLLPTTYQTLPLTPSPELLAPETLSGSELGAWSRLGAGASLEFGMSLELGATAARPTQDPGKHFSLCCFFFVLQEKKKKKKAMPSPSSSSLCRGACYSELATQAPNSGELRSLHFFHAASSEPQRAPELAELQRALEAPELACCWNAASSESSGACRAPESSGSSGACLLLERSKLRKLRSLLAVGT